MEKNKKDVLSIDLETYSSVDIKKSGMYKYIESEDFEILLFAYSLNGEEPHVVDILQGETIPADIITRLNDCKTELRAYNAAFEYTALKRAGFETNLNQWKCTMAQGLYASYPAGLGEIAKALELDDKHLKDTKGKALIKQFSTDAGAGKKKWRNYPADDMAGWQAYKEYNKQDVVTEMAVLKALEKFEMPEDEWRLWRLDVKTNLRGVKLDREFFESVLEYDELLKESLIEEFKELTDGVNARSPLQFKKWIESKGINVKNTGAEEIRAVIEKLEDGEVKKALELSLLIKKSSLAKYTAMQDVAGKDDRARGLTQYYGGNRTGRWAGRLIQAQNLPRNHQNADELAELKYFIKENKFATAKAIFGSEISDLLASLIRTTFIAEKGKKFIVTDFASIESRVLSWLSGEKWRNEVFAGSGKIYEQTAALLFNVDASTIAKDKENYHLRAKGKIAELACGYGIGADAFSTRYDMEVEEAQELITNWRGINPAVVQFWHESATLFKNIVLGFTDYGYVAHGKIRMARNGRNIEVTLPSGRQLFYLNVRMEGTELRYSIGGSKGFKESKAYGGKLVENFTQAVARDFLAHALLSLEKQGFKVVMHIHDEVVIEAEQQQTLEEVNEILQKNPSWAPDIVLKVAGFENTFYMKD